MNTRLKVGGLRYFRRMVVLLIFAVFTGLSLQAQWHYLGMKNRVVHRLKIEGDTIYAATDHGIYKRSWHATDTTWIPAGLQGERVVDLALACRERIFAYTHNSATGEFYLYYSSNGGLTYTLFRTDPGIANFYYDNTSSYVEIAPGQTDTLFLLPHWQYTHDGGVTWHTIPFDPTTVGNFIRFIRVNPDNPSEVWIGGETMIFSAFLLHSVNGGVSYDWLPSQGFFQGDNCMHDIIADGDDWFVAGEGLVSHTGNLGVTWNEKLNLWNSQYGLYLNAIAFSPASRNTMYVTGGGNGSWHEIVFMATHDRGLTWDTLTWTPFAGGSYYMLTMAVARGSFDKVFLGGYHGVYLYDGMPTSVPVHPGQQVSVFPNPVRDHIRISFHEGAEAGSISASIYDLAGRMVYMHNNIPVDMQGATLHFRQPAGTYILVIHSGERLLYRGKLIAQ